MQSKEFPAASEVPVAAREAEQVESGNSTFEAREPQDMNNKAGKGAARSRLGVGFVGSGFNARFHMQAFRAVRDAAVRGIWSPNSQHAASAAAFVRDLDVGEARAYASIGDMVADPAIDAI